MEERPLILVSNDDGVQAQGIHVLTQIMAQLGDVIVVGPDSARSGAACSISAAIPVRLTQIDATPGCQVYACSGSPVDCVKLALEQVVPRRPDLLVSGINHGDNASISLHYSGTIGAVLEACMKGIPAIGYSLRTRDQVCDFHPYEKVVRDTAMHVLQHGLPQDVCLNVNFPQVDVLAGVRVCRMARGSWNCEWMPAETDGEFRLTGIFHNLEPDSKDTDYWALDHGMAAITPLQLDMTSYSTLNILSHLNSCE